MNRDRFLGFALSPIASAAFGLVTVPFLAWTFSAEDVGRLNIFQITVSFCLLLFTLGLDQAYVREFHEHADRAQLLKACFTPGFVLLILFCLLIMACGIDLSKFLYDTSIPILLWLTLASIIAAFISRFSSLVLRMQERGLAFSMSQIIPKALFLAILGILFANNLPLNFLTLLSVFFASNIAVTGIYLWNTQDQWRPALTARQHIRQLRSLLNYGIPLIFSGLAYWGLTATSSIALRSLSTFSELGIYSVTTSIAGVATIFQSIFSIVWAPIVYRWVAEGVDLKRIDRLAQQALAAVCVIFATCGIFSWITDFILPEKYAAVKYLVICAIAQPLLYILSEITCVGINITRRTILGIWATVIALCTNILLSLWLVPIHGAAGAVVANAMAYQVFFIARTEFSARAWRNFLRARLYIYTCLAVAFSVVTAILGSTLPFHYVLLWLTFIPVVGWFFSKELSEISITIHHILKFKIR